MKKLFFIFAITLAVMAITPAPSQAAVNSSHEYALSVDPFDLLIGDALNLTFESKINNKNSFTLGFDYYHYNSNWSAIGFGASYRWYIDLFKEGKKGMNGFSVGPMAKVSWWTYDGNNTNYDNSAYVVVGGECAYKWIFSSGWMIEPILRLGFGVNNVDGLDYSGWGAGINLGYTW